MVFPIALLAYASHPQSLRIFDHAILKMQYCPLDPRIHYQCRMLLELAKSCRLESISFQETFHKVSEEPNQPFTWSIHPFPILPYDDILKSQNSATKVLKWSYWKLRRIINIGGLPTSALNLDIILQCLVAFSLLAPISRRAWTLMEPSWTYLIMSGPMGLLILSHSRPLPLQTSARSTCHMLLDRSHASRPVTQEFPEFDQVILSHPVTIQTQTASHDSFTLDYSSALCPLPSNYQSITKPLPTSY